MLRLEGFPPQRQQRGNLEGDVSRNFSTNSCSSLAALIPSSLFAHLFVVFPTAWVRPRRATEGGIDSIHAAIFQRNSRSPSSNTTDDNSRALRQQGETSRPRVSVKLSKAPMWGWLCEILAARVPQQACERPLPSYRRMSTRTLTQGGGLVPSGQEIAFTSSPHVRISCFSVADRATVSDLGLNRSAFAPRKND